MIEIAFTEDKELIKKVLNDPFIQDNTKDDFSSIVNDFEVGKNLFLSVTIDKELKGLFVCTPLNSICFNVHTCLLPKISSKDIFEVVRLSFNEIFNKTYIEKLITLVPLFNKKAIRFAVFNGWELEGKLTKSFLRNGFLYDQFVYGFTKEKWECQQYQ